MILKSKIFNPFSKINSDARIWLYSEQSLVCITKSDALATTITTRKIFHSSPGTFPRREPASQWTFNCHPRGHLRIFLILSFAVVAIHSHGWIRNNDNLRVFITLRCAAFHPTGSMPQMNEDDESEQVQSRYICIMRFLITRQELWNHVDSTKSGNTAHPKTTFHDNESPRLPWLEKYVQY